MSITFFLKKLVYNPYVEVSIRYFYWKNYKLLKRFKPKFSSSSNVAQDVNFDNIINYLKEQGVKEGDLIIVHSSYESLLGTKLGPKQIISKLKELVGEKGTVAMPVIRHYKGEPKPEDILKTDVSNLICEYDPKNTPIVTGLLPFYLMKDKSSITSLHPLNPLTAIGPLAENMMKYNLEGNKPSPHGSNSSWKFCHDNKAKIIGLGIDMQHYITMIHVAEEAYPNWIYPNWYRTRIFDINTPNGKIRKEVSERKPKWGMLHIAEYKYGNDFRKNNIFIEKKIDGIQTTVIDSNELVSFLRNKNKKIKGYPYFTIKTIFK